MRARHVRRAGALAAVAIGLPLLAACGATVQSFEIGECLDMSDTSAVDQVEEVPSVGCDEPHDAEVFAILTYEDGDFPGDDAVGTQLETYCMEQFTAYTGSDYATSIYYLGGLLPSEDSWDRANDREGICLLTTSEMRTDSARDSGL